MARTVLTLQETARTGLEVTYASADATNDHSWDNTGQNVLIQVVNGGGGAVECTFLTPLTVDDLVVAEQIVSIPAGEERIFGPFRNDLYGQADSPNSLAKAVLLDLDIDTTVTIAAIQIGDVNF